MIHAQETAMGDLMEALRTRAMSYDQGESIATSPMDSLTTQLFYEWATPKEDAGLPSQEEEGTPHTRPTMLALPLGSPDVPRSRKPPPPTDFLLSPTVNQNNGPISSGPFPMPDGRFPHLTLALPSAKSEHSGFPGRE